MSTRIDKAVTLILVCAAVAVGGAALHREFAPQPAVAQEAVSPPTYIANWREILSQGMVLGDTNAKTVLVEFGDFECPYCGRFHAKYEAARQRLGDDLAFVFVHFPLPSHRFARPAARAAECSVPFHAVAAMQAKLFEKQDSLGLKSWGSYAAEAGIRDTATFSRCVTDTARVDRIERGIALGTRLAVHATPTVLINGWRYSVPPYDSLVDELVRRSRQ